MTNFFKITVFLILGPSLFHAPTYAMSWARPLQTEKEISENSSPLAKLESSTPQKKEAPQTKREVVIEPPKTKTPQPEPVPQPSPQPSATPKTDKPIKPPTKSTQWKPEWTQILDRLNIVERMTKTPKDISLLCPRYESLSGGEKSEFWTSFFRALAQAESSFDPTCTTLEPGLGKDAVTGLQIRSEGLLQLSYQDAPYYHCDFNWAKDKALHQQNIRNPEKSIFNPEKNLACGVDIFLRQIKKRGRIFTNFYWAPLKAARKNSGYKNLVGALNPQIKQMCQ
jgi:hypothetical protein